MARLILVLLLAAPLPVHAQPAEILVDSLLDAGAADGITDIAAGLLVDPTTPSGTAVRVKYTHGDWRRVTAVASPIPGIQLAGAWQEIRGGGQRGYAAVASVRSWGVLEHAVVGGLRARFGESLVLGSSPSTYPAMKAAAPGAGMVVTSSTSMWSPVEGAAVSMKWERAHVGTVGMRQRDDPGVAQVWLTGGVLGPRGTAGLAGGIDDLGGRAVSASAAMSLASLVLAGEGAWRSGLPSGLVRVAGGERFVCAIEVYSRERFAPGSLARLSSTSGRERGGATHFRFVAPAVRARVSLWASTRAQPDRQYIRRRFEAAVAGTRDNGDRWRAELRRSDTVRRSPSGRDYDTAVDYDVEQELRLRVSYSVVTPALEHEHRMVLYPERRGVGILATWRMTARWAGTRLTTSVSAHDLVRDAPVAPTGIHGLDTVALVTGVGADVSLRLTIPATAAGTLGLYAARSGGRDARVYLFASLSG